MKKSSVLTIALLGLSLGASASAQTTPASGPAPKRVRLLLNGTYNPQSLVFSETSTFTQFVEEGSATRRYDGGKGVVFEAGAIIGITRAFGIMGSLEFFESDFDAAFEDRLPHPLFFDRHRSVTGTLPGLGYSEKAVHLDAVFSRAFSAMTLDLFGGPTFFLTNTEVLNTVSTASEYPFDEATVTSTSLVTLDDNPIGFNAGGSLTWRLTEVFGLAFQARYSQATIQVAREGGDDIELDAGGFRVGGGIRIAF